MKQKDVHRHKHAYQPTFLQRLFLRKFRACLSSGPQKHRKRRGVGCAFDSYFYKFFKFIWGESQTETERQHPYSFTPVRATTTTAKTRIQELSPGPRKVWCEPTLEPPRVCISQGLESGARAGSWTRSLALQRGMWVSQPVSQLLGHVATPSVCFNCFSHSSGIRKVISRLGV